MIEHGLIECRGRRIISINENDEYASAYDNTGRFKIWDEDMHIGIGHHVAAIVPEPDLKTARAIWIELTEWLKERNPELTCTIMVHYHDFPMFSMRPNKLIRMIPILNGEMVFDAIMLDMTFAEDFNHLEKGAEIMEMIDILRKEKGV